tara:strand:+ start:312 stop:470 length:159 start_codon:yes stop_codon:yes gene_type:complete
MARSCVISKGCPSGGSGIQNLLDPVETIQMLLLLNAPVSVDQGDPGRINAVG